MNTLDPHPLVGVARTVANFRRAQQHVSRRVVECRCDGGTYLSDPLQDNQLLAEKCQLGFASRTRSE
jgi:hypothetical protein